MTRSAAKRNRGQNTVVGENQDSTDTESSGNPRERKIPTWTHQSTQMVRTTPTQRATHPKDILDGGSIRSKPTRRQDGNFLMREIQEEQ